MRHLMWAGLVGALLASAHPGLADGPQDNLPDNVRRIPKLGIEVPPQQREALQAKLDRLGDVIEALREKDDAFVNDLLPDVMIYHRAADQALNYQEFFREREIAGAEELLDEGLDRAAQLAQGEADWTTARGLVVRGFISKIDDTVQPYGLVVPESWRPGAAQTHRLDLWFHGRNENITENAFLLQRRSRVGQYAPADTFVLHPFGRYSNAFKFAGETDVFEAMAEVKRRYPIDEDRVSVRGFSMGGAGCWQFAVHSSDEFFAANPGAGFSETPEFLKFFQGQELDPTWWERRLWNLYDCDKWALNLYHLPTIAYSGENDRQKQAADVMEAALAKLGIDLVHVIGPQMGHRIDDGSKAIIEDRLASLARVGRQRVPRKVYFTTYTLKYNRMKWVTVEGMAEHWAAAQVGAQIRDESTLNIVSDNVTDLLIEFAPGEAPLDIARPVSIAINGQTMDGPRPTIDRAFTARLHLAGNRWRLGARPAREGVLRKRHDLQGPIDDAFMSRFIFVRPTGAASHQKVSAWAERELERAIEHWRRHFRGDAIVKRDIDITEEDIASAHLVLWGSPSSNSVLRRVMADLPIGWDPQVITAGRRQFAADEHALVMIHPNPLNPDRYVVLNSSFTFRDFAYLNNARQVPMLPDWAVVNLNTPPNAVWPGEIVAADFFDETWELKPDPGARPDSGAKPDPAEGVTPTRRDR